MLHHASLGVSDIERSAAFYDTTLAALGYVRVWDDIRPGQTGQAIGYGLPGGSSGTHASGSWRSLIIVFIISLTVASGFFWLFVNASRIAQRN